jgi:sugar lactone lactonase YvrE
MIYKNGIFLSYIIVLLFSLIFSNCHKTTNMKEKVKNENIEKDAINISNSAVKNIEAIQKPEIKEEKINYLGKMTVDTLGNIYVIDIHYNTIKKIDNSGKIYSLVKIDNPYRGGPPLPSTGIAVDASGNIYITIDSHIMKVDNSMKLTILMEDGKWGNIDVEGTPATFNDPRSVTVDTSGNVYIVLNREVVMIANSGMIHTLVDNSTSGSKWGWSGTFNDIAVDADRNIYLTDGNLNRIIKVDNSGIASVIAGGNYSGEYADGQGEAAKFNYPGSIAVDSSGNIYVTDSYNNCIRKIDSSGMVSTFAGDRTKGYVNGEKTSAQFDSPGNIAIDGLGNLYVADNTGIRKIDNSGMVSTLVVAEK